MQGNVLGQNILYSNTGGSSGNLMFPVYQQTTEPKDKYGVWIKSNEVIEDIYISDNIFDKYTRLNGVVPYQVENINFNKAIVVDTDIYLLASSTSDSNYIYHTLTNTFEELIDPDDYVYPRSEGVYKTVVYKDNIIKLMDATISSKSNILFKIQNPVTKEDTYTNTLYAYDVRAMSITIVGDDIYIFGITKDNSGSASSLSKVYKYNITTDTYTKLNDVPVMDQEQIYQVKLAVVDTNIYIFNNHNTRTCYKYNTITNNYTQMENMPYLDSGSIKHSLSIFGCCVIDSDIFIFDTASFKGFKFNTLTNKFTILDSVYTFTPKNIALCCVVNNTIYFLKANPIETIAEEYNIELFNFTYNEVIKNKCIMVIPPERNRPNFK